MSNSQCRRNDDLQRDRQQDLLSGSCEAALYGRHEGAYPPDIRR
jgi:hypothetical protein